MPPKSQATKQSKTKEVENTIIDKSFSLTIKGIFPIIDNDSYYLRIVSTWLDCCSSTDVIGTSSIPFVTQTSNDTKICTYSYGSDPVLNAESLVKFNENPNIYVFLFKKIESTYESKPILFSSIDCSIFALEKNDISTRSEVVNDIYLTVSISCKTPLFHNTEDLLLHEPLVLNIQGVVRYPLFENQDIRDALKSTYFFNQFDVGTGVQRQIFGYPVLPETSVNVTDESIKESMNSTNDNLPSIIKHAPSIDSDDDDDGPSSSNSSIAAFNNSTYRPNSTKITTVKFKKSKRNNNSISETQLLKQTEIPEVIIDIKVCLFPGITSLDKFKELISTHTYAIEFHNEKLASRLFSRLVVYEYNKMLSPGKYSGKLDDDKGQKNTEEVKTVSKDSSKDKKKGDKDGGSSSKKVDKGKQSKQAASQSLSSQGPITPPDIYLISVITKGLQTSKVVNVHSAARFRLEQLLTNSADLLAKFALKRQELAAAEQIPTGLNDTATRDVSASGSSEVNTGVTAPIDIHSNTQVLKQQLQDKLHVICNEELILDLRYQKPYKPLPWERPEDISLKSALESHLITNNELVDKIKTVELSSSIKVLSEAVSTKKLNVNIANEVSTNKISIFESLMKHDTQLHVMVELHRLLKLKSTKPQEIDTIPEPIVEDTPVIAPVSKNVTSKQLNKATANTRPTSPKNVSKKPSSAEKKSSEIPKSNSQVNTDEAIVPNTSANTGANTDAKSDDDKLEVDDTDKKSEVEREIELLKRLSVTPFARMCFIMKYDNDEMLEKINEVITVVNMRALPDIQGTIRSYSLSANELHDCENATLDLITGVMIIDDVHRIIVIEGLAAPNRGMEYVYMNIMHEKPNDDDLKILLNPTILFPHRLYPNYGPDLKRIHLRFKLKKLMNKYELYDYKQVDIECLQGLDCLVCLKRDAVDLLSSKQYNMFPSMQSLDKLELLYGEAISLKDIYGKSYVNSRKRKGNEDNQVEDLTGSYNDTAFNISRRVHMSRIAALDCYNDDFITTIKNRPQHRIDYLNEQKIIRKAAWRRFLMQTQMKREKQLELIEMIYKINVNNHNQQNTLNDSLNSFSNSFNNSLKGSSFPSLSNNNLTTNGLTISQNNLTSSINMNSAVDAYTIREPMSLNQTRNMVKEKLKTLPKIYIYSNQTLNIKNKSLVELKSRLIKDKSSTYTYSKDYTSQSVAFDNLNEINNYIENGVTSKYNFKVNSKNKEWLTPTGFQYPKPKTIEDLITHPKKPSLTRIDDLKEPWPNDLYPPQRNVIGVSSKLTTEQLKQLIHREDSFELRNKVDETFGMLKMPQYEYDIKLAYIGDKKTLPRGNLIEGNKNDKDSTFFDSIHVGGDKKAKILEEAAKKEKEDWKAKVVVDNESFQVGGFLVKEKVTSQQDYSSDILHDKPNTLALKKIRVLKSATKGLDWSYHTTPMSIMKSGPYIDNIQTTLTLRHENKKNFITAKFSDGDDSKILDFTRYIPPDASAPRITKLISKKSHPPLDKTSKECTGPKWDALA